VKIALATLLLAVTVATAKTEIELVDPFDYVCEEVGNIYSKPDVCEGMPEPIVIVTDAINTNPWLRLNGVYLPGERYVFVSPTGTNPERTIEHEITHYVLHNAKLVDDKDKCEHERIARHVAGQAWDDPTKARYGCDAPETN
jgi:hypothetical protein